MISRVYVVAVLEGSRRAAKQEAKLLFGESLQEDSPIVPM